jgi:hypothetical protein
MAESTFQNLPFPAKSSPEQDKLSAIKQGTGKY